MNSKQLIVNLIRAEYERAIENYRRLYAEYTGILAAYNTWAEFNEDDGVGGMSCNPYNVCNADKKANEARIHQDKMKDAYKLAVDTFLKGGDEL